MSEPREFWIDKDEDRHDGELLSEIRPSHVNENKFIRAIEYSAYEALEENLRVAVEALEFYAAHNSVIKEAYHSNDAGQITCVHTFINHQAVEALAKIKGSSDDL